MFWRRGEIDDLGNFAIYYETIEAKFFFIIVSFELLFPIFTCEHFLQTTNQCYFYVLVLIKIIFFSFEMFKLHW